MSTGSATGDDATVVRLVHAAADDATDATAPAVLVTAWLLADLADSPAVLVEQVGTTEIHLRPVEDDDGATSRTLRLRIQTLLRDARLTGWALDADMTRTLLEADPPHGVAKADTS